MIEKIISGGQSGACRAALDAAIRLGIAHGGWISKHEAGDADPPPARYLLHEIPSDAPTAKASKNIQESDGTLILCHGGFKGHADFVQNIAARFDKPVLHVDLNDTAAFNAATLINDWIVDNEIRVLNVTGPRQEQDPKIYQATLDIIQAVFFLNLTEANMSNPIQAGGFNGRRVADSPPKTLSNAIALILSEMPLKDRTTMANLREEELPPLQLTLGLYIKRRLNEWQRSEAFNASCLAAAGEEGMDASNPTMVVIRKLWQRLRDTHRLRVVK